MASPLDAPYDPEQPHIMPTTPDSPGVGALAELSGSAISSTPSPEVGARVQEIEMIPVDDGSTPVVLDSNVPPLAMPLPLASNAVIPSSGIPSAASTPGPYRSSIRRARVDDDDDERDRRHPSQRISSNSNSATGTPTMPTYNRQTASNFTAGSLPIFTHLTPGQPGGALNPADLYAHTHPGTSFSGFPSPSAMGIASSDINNSNSAPVASPDNLNSSTATSGPEGSGPGSITGQSAHTSHPQSSSRPAQDQPRQNRANAENRPLVQLFDYGFSFVVDQDGARPLRIQQRRGPGRQRGTTPNGSSLNPPTPPLAPIGSERHTQSRPQAQQQQQHPPPPPPQQTFPETQPPQMPLPPGAPPGGEGPNPDLTSIPMPPGLAANLANLFSIPFGIVGTGPGGFTFGLPPYEEKEDPERARKLIEGLEKVPVGLVRRLERVGKGGGVGEEGGKGGDAGCAVCWERLLENDAEAKPVTTTVVGKDVDVEDDNMVIDSEGAEAITPTTSKEEPSKSTLPTIVSLPCAHVFHADCLIPWFSRPKHTTCPTCRFNIDPDNLTYVSAAARRRRREERERRDGQGSTADVAADGADTNVEGTRSEGNETSATGGANDEGGPAGGRNQQEDEGEEGEDEEDGFNFNPAEGGGGFTGLLQMLNAQTQMDSGVPAPTAPTTGAGADPTQPAPQPQGGQGPHMPMPWPFMPMPGPGGAPNPDQSNVQGNISNPNPAPNFNHNANPGGPHQPPQFRGFPPPGMGVGMQAFSIPVANGVMFGGPRLPGFNQSHPPNAAAASPDDAATQPTHQGPASAQPADQNPGQVLGQRPANLMADVLRVTVDMVFEAPHLSQGGRLGGQRHQQQQEDTLDQDRGSEENHGDGGDNDESDDDGGDDEDEEEEMPGLVDDRGQLQELVDLIMNGGGGQGREDNADNGNDEADARTAGNGEHQPIPPQQRQAQEQTQHPAPQPPPRQPHEPQDATPPLNFQNLGGIHLASGSGRSLGEAITQMISSFMRGGPGQPHPGPGPGPTGPTTGQGQQPMADGGGGAQPQPGQTQGQNQGQNQGQQQGQQQEQQPPLPPWQFIPVPFPPGFEFPMMPRRQHGTKRPWAPPPAPGPTLRQRVEKREREEGLRCHDVSCGLGPSDDEPFSPSELGGGTAAGTGGRKRPYQLVIVSNKEVGKEFNERQPACEHLFHSSCLVSAERVKLRGADAVAGEDGCVEVSCPVCRNVGCVRKEQWDEGVGALQ